MGEKNKLKQTGRVGVGVDCAGFTLLAKLTLCRASTTFCSDAPRFTVQKIQITEDVGKSNQTEAKAKSFQFSVLGGNSSASRPVKSAEHYQLEIHARTQN